MSEAPELVGFHFGLVERGTTGCASGANDMRLQHNGWKFASLSHSSVRFIDEGVPNYCWNATEWYIILTMLSATNHTKLSMLISPDNSSQVYVGRR